jgi:hypothetical protein
MHAGQWFLITLAVVGQWAWRAYFHPFAPCWRCKGKKTNPGSTGKRFGKCRRCRGSGSRQVIGSKTVHRAVRGVRSARDKRET